jgi:flagellar basal-body rod modification protein FlgD
MASVGTLFPTTTQATSSSASASSPSSPSASATQSSSSSNSLANQSTFLQLLVAQLQYQDPTQPMDGTTFVTQLAQFSDLQQNTGTRQDLDGIAKSYLGSIPSQSTSSSSTTNNAATSSTSTLP